MASLSLQGMGEAFILEGSADSTVFELYIEQILAPSFPAGHIVILGIDGHFGGNRDGNPAQNRTDLPCSDDGMEGDEHIKSTDDLLDVVVDFIDAVIPGHSFLIAGTSYGGYLSRGVLRRKFDQVAGMALICPVIFGDRSQRDLPPRTVIVENARFLAKLVPADAEEYSSLAVVQNEENWQRFRDEILSGMRIADEAFLQRISQRYRYSFDVDVLPQPFSKPVVILAGRQDQVTGYRDAWRILENYPRGTFAVLDRAGHNAHIEQSHLFQVLVGEWLDRVRESMQREEDDDR